MNANPAELHLWHETKEVGFPQGIYWLPTGHFMSVWCSLTLSQGCINLPNINSNLPVITTRADGTVICLQISFMRDDASLIQYSTAKIYTKKKGKNEKFSLEIVKLKIIGRIRKLNAKRYISFYSRSVEMDKFQVFFFWVSHCAGSFPKIGILQALQNNYDAIN